MQAEWLRQLNRKNAFNLELEELKAQTEHYPQVNTHI
jgi:hypothetical protein